MVDGWGTCSIPPTRELVHRLGRVEERGNDDSQRIINKAQANPVEILAQHTNTLVFELTKPQFRCEGEGAIAGPIQDGIQI